MKTLSIRLTDELAAQLEAESHARKMSKSDIVRERLINSEQTFAPSEWSEVLAGVVGSVDGLPADLSSNVKAYLKSSGYGRNRSR